MKERSFDEMIAYFNRRVADMDINQDYKMELLGMVMALGFKHEKSAQTERKRGKWMVSYLEHEAVGIRPKLLYCSECCQCMAYSTNFCPNCGADMRGEDK